MDRRGSVESEQKLIVFSPSLILKTFFSILDEVFDMHFCAIFNQEKSHFGNSKFLLCFVNPHSFNTETSELVSTVYVSLYPFS